MSETKRRFWRGDNGAKRKPKVRWASMRMGFVEDGDQIVFRWGEGENINQKTVYNEDMAELLAKSWIKGNFEEIPQKE